MKVAETSVTTISSLSAPQIGASASTSQMSKMLNRAVNSNYQLTLNGKEKTKGAGMAVGGAALQGIGKKVGATGGLSAKLAGAGISLLGKSLENAGKKHYGGTGKNNGSPSVTNAFAGFYTGRGIGKK